MKHHRHIKKRTMKCVRLLQRVCMSCWANCQFQTERFLSMCSNLFPCFCIDNLSEFSLAGLWWWVSVYHTKYHFVRGAQCLKSNKLYLVSQVGWLYWIHLSIFYWIYAIPLSFHHSPSACKKKHAKKNSKTILFFSFIRGKNEVLTWKMWNMGF